MIKHIVFFRLAAMSSESEKKAHLVKIKQALEVLPEVIDSLAQMEVVFNVNPAEPYDFALIALVPDMAALADYANHPAHQQVVKELIVPYKEARACVDYEV